MAAVMSKNAITCPLAAKIQEEKAHVVALPFFFTVFWKPLYVRHNCAKWLKSFAVATTFAFTIFSPFAEDDLIFGSVDNAFTFSYIWCAKRWLWISITSLLERGSC